ncbi:MAG: hydrogenase 2 small subunit, partial [Acidobacteriota bacterium]|jgi:hypothetical protein
VFNIPIHTTVDIERPMPPDTYPPIVSPRGGATAVATGVIGAAVGAAAGAAYMASKQLKDEDEESGEED